MAAQFDWLTGTLAIGGALEPPAFAALPGLGIGAVVDLRAEDCDDARLLSRLGVALLSLPTEDHQAPSAEDLDRGVAFTRDAQSRGQGVLVHCQHGIGRSALLALCVLTAAGEAPLAALGMIKRARPIVSPSPAQYRAWVAWLARAGASPGAAWPPPDWRSFCAIAYRGPGAG